jgi:lipopolysaccharide export system permease protein
MSLVVRYLLSGFNRIFLLSLATFAGIYLLVDFVENVDNFLAHQARLSDYLIYFFGKLPMILAVVAFAAAF